MRSTWVLALAVVLAGPAVAQDTAPGAPATEAGAKALATDLASYFSQAAFDRKVVTVTPEGNGYRVTFAFNTAIAPMLEAGAKVDVSPWSVLASQRSDGNWDVSSSDPLAFMFDVTVEGIRQMGDYRIEPGRFAGVFSPKLGAFVSGSGDYPGGSMTTSDPQSDIEATFGKTTYEIGGKEAGEGAVDATLRQTLAGLKEKISVKGDASAGIEPVTVDVASKAIAVDSDMKGFESRALMDIWAFAVAHADKEKIVADQERLRGLLSAALPLWKSFEGVYAFGGFEIDTAYGRASMDRLSVSFGGDGVSTSSAFTYAIGFEGLAAQSPMMPAWAAGLVPEDFDLKLNVSGLDLETPAKRAIADFDLARDEPLPAATSEAIAAAFAKNPPRLVIQPSRLKSRDVEVTVAGDFAFESAEPEMNLTVEAAGLDKAISTLQGQAAADPSINEVVGGLALAKGFAKALPDGRSQWVIATKADGSVILNGNQLVPPTVEATDPAPTDENALPTETPGTGEPAQ